MCPLKLSSGLVTTRHQEGTTEAPESSEGGVGQSPTVAERKPAHFEIPRPWLECALATVRARPSHLANYLLDVEVLPVGKHYLAKALIRSGSNPLTRFIGEICPTELEALQSLEPLLVRYSEARS